MNRPPEIVQEAIEAIENMLVRFDGKKKHACTVGVRETFYLEVVLQELGRLRSEAALFASAQP